jgi:hypothetical protein
MSRQSLEDLKPLLPESIASDDLDKGRSSNAEPRCRGLWCRTVPLIALLTVSVLLNVALIVRPMDPGKWFIADQKLYSKWNGSLIIFEFCVTREPAPVQDVLEYETKLFLHSLDISPYHGPPSDAVDQAWQDLYSCEYFLAPALETGR